MNKFIKTIKYAFEAILIAALLGCYHELPLPERSLLPELQRPFHNQENMKPYQDIMRAGFQTADILANILKNRNIGINNSIIAASFVNINNLEESSTFGRVISDQITARLSQNGYNIKEIKLRSNSIFIKEKAGEFLLSRELKNIINSHNANAVLVGTYAITSDMIFVSARVVTTDSNTIIAAHNFQLYSNPIVKEMLLLGK